MPRPETDMEAKRQQIMEAADQIIQDKGAISFTMTDLAAAAGMSQSNLYRFFESKDALAEAMAGEWFADLEVIMAGAKRFTDAIADGTAMAEGDASILDKIAGTLVVFNPFFEVLPGTAAPVPDSSLNPYAIQGEATYIRGE